MSSTPYETFYLGDLPLESGRVLPGARLAYKTHGRLNRDRSNVILLPSFITGTHDGYAPFLASERCFDPAQYFIVATNMFGNGLSTSPSTLGGRYEDYPRVSIRDNVNAQYQLLAKYLGVKHLALAAGYSMGGLQAYQWAVSHPQFVSRLAVWCAHSRTTPHMKTFLGALRSSIERAKDWLGGEVEASPGQACQALARTFAPWALSAAWYDREGWSQLGFSSLDEFLERFLDATMARLDLRDFLAQVDTWMSHDVGDSATFAGWQSALASVRAEALIMPCRTDQYFTCEQSRADACHITGSAFTPIESDWGHFAGLGLDASAVETISTAIIELLARPQELAEHRATTR